MILCSILSSVYSLLFFFYSSGDHRDLHSFPTRRSSDLQLQGQRRHHRRLCCASAGARHPRKLGALGLSRCGRRSEEHTSELQSRQYLVCRLLLEKKKKKYEQKDHCKNKILFNN